MGLSQRKDKQKIGHDPRNLGWSNDASRFSYKHMANLGWDTTSGLGADGSGNPNHIAVARKLDNSGIGVGRARREGEELSSGAGQAGASFEAVLRRLAASQEASPVPTETKSDECQVEAVVDTTAKILAPVPRRMASRHKHLMSKRSATSSPAALAEILGIPISSLPASPSPTPDPASTPVRSDAAIEGRISEEITTKSSLSVNDYFREKLRQKALERAAAAGLPAPVQVENKYTAPPEAKLIGGIAFEGRKTLLEDKEPVAESSVHSLQERIESVEPLKAEGKKRKRDGLEAVVDETTSGATETKKSKKKDGDEVEETKEEKAARRAAKQATKDAKRAEKEAKAARKAEKAARKVAAAA